MNCPALKKRDGFYCLKYLNEKLDVQKDVNDIPQYIFHDEINGECTLPIPKKVRIKL
jgi:hypothetical protein